jgi:haloalkane dehalogenase
MTSSPISTHDSSLRKTVAVRDSTMAYVDVGEGAPVVFLHGNPTYSFLWRNVIPHVQERTRCLAPDLIGMGYSGKAPGGSYRFRDHSLYVDAWFEALGLRDCVTLVVHDWGSALGFDWARRHPEAVAGIVYMEAIVQPLSWKQWPEVMRPLFQTLRTPAGEEMILEKNLFVEVLLPGAMQRRLSEDEMNAYRAPYLDPGASRRPMLDWPREIPLDGEPSNVVGIVGSYGRWLEDAAVPKLFINADPGTILTGQQREYCRSWPHQTELTVPGIHYVQEDSADRIGQAIAEFVHLNVANRSVTDSGGIG